MCVLRLQGAQNGRWMSCGPKINKYTIRVETYATELRGIFVSFL